MLNHVARLVTLPYVQHCAARLEGGMRGRGAGEAGAKAVLRLFQGTWYTNYAWAQGTSSCLLAPTKITHI